MAEENRCDHIVTNTDKRWVYLASVIVTAVVLTLPVFIALSIMGIAALSAVPQAWFLLYSTVVLMGTVWLLGKDKLDAVRRKHDE